MLAIARSAGRRKTMARVLGEAGIEVRQMATITEIDESLGTGSGKELALIDLEDFDQRIWPVCEELRRVGVPFVLITNGSNAQDERKGLAHGASAVLAKPLNVGVFIAIVRSLVEDRLALSSKKGRKPDKGKAARPTWRRPSGRAPSRK